MSLRKAMRMELTSEVKKGIGEMIVSNALAFLKKKNGEA